MPMPKSSFYIFCLLLSALVGSAQAQIESISLRGLITLKNPSSNKLYRVTDAGKQGDWKYDATDNESIANGGTVLESANRTIKGRYKRVFEYEDGVNIDWFLDNPSAPINEGLLWALAACDRVNFTAKTYIIAPIVITPKQLVNPRRLRLYFQNTVLKAQNGLNKIKVLHLEDIQELTLGGSLTLDGNTSNLKIANPINEGGEAFLQITAPANNPKSRLTIGSITFRNIPMCAINIFTRDQERDSGYDRIRVKAFREINGFNCLNLQKDDFAVWGVNVRGAHRAVIIDSLYAQQDKEVWGDAPIEKPFYTFTFENQVDPIVHKRKDSLYVKHLYVKYSCAIVLYTQAINNVRIDNYVMEDVLRKPGVADAAAYPNMLKKNLSWVGSKHTWTSYRSPKSSFHIKKMLVKNTNSAFMSESVMNEMTVLWLNKAITGAVFDEIETDVRLKLYGDGYYFNYPDVPDGRHRIGTFVCRIPAKKNYVQPLGSDLTIDRLHLAKGTGVTFAMGNCKIGAITQEVGTQATFESRENKFKNDIPLYNGFIVESCKATDILWKFNWYIPQENFADLNKVSRGERYEFKNFSGNNFLQTHTSVGLPDGRSIYVTAFRYDEDSKLRTSVQQFLNFVEFNWTNVEMRLKDSSASDLTQRYLPMQSSAEGLLKTARKSLPKTGWKKGWQPSSFVKCTIQR